MNNNLKIDKIIEELTEKVGKLYPQDIDNNILNNTQIELKNFLKNHRIHYLIHFTDAKNIPSIKQNGILSVKELDNRKIKHIKNDNNRYDKELDYISLSISGMNKHLYKVFKYNNHSINHGVAVVINAEILYKEINTHRIYCKTNAATSNSNKGDSINDLISMFDDIIEYTTSTTGNRIIDRNKENRSSYEPTDVQAEILWNKCVPTEYILFYWDLEEDFFYGN